VLTSNYIPAANSLSLSLPRKVDQVRRKSRCRRRRRPYDDASMAAKDETELDRQMGNVTVSEKGCVNSRQDLACERNREEKAGSRKKGAVGDFPSNRRCKNTIKSSRMQFENHK
jgi:hypothetical protein